MIGEEQVSDILRDKGIPTNIKGFGYMKVAIALMLEDTSLKGVLHKVMYPEIAKRFGTTPTGVERALRYAVGKYTETKAVGRFIDDCVEDLEMASNA